VAEGGTRRRLGSAVGGLLVLSGSVVVAVCVAARPGPALTTYVSEAGAPSGADASAYRLGVLALAAGLLALAAAVPSALRLAAGLLGASAVGAALSGAVTCSAGCPLPPYEAATPRDLVHGAASIAAVAACVFAMMAVAATPAAPPGLRRISAGAAIVALPLSALAGIGLLAVGRGALVGVTERVLLAVVAAWLVALAGYLAVSRVFAGPGVEAEAPSRS
jgi:hypothetical protein